MSLTSYIGCDVEIPVMANDAVVEDNKLYVASSYADEEILQAVSVSQFKTPYVYEVTFDGWGIELSSGQDEVTYEKNKQAIQFVCDIMDPYLQKGESFYFYTYWISDESNPREAEMTLSIQGWFKEGMELKEKTMIKFIK